MKIPLFKPVFPVIFCFLPLFFVSAQTAITLPPSPEAQSLLKAVNVQVNKCTGIAGLTVPLCDAGSGAISVPVSLSYACAAIKVQDIASWVGTGWNLSVGGKITRVIADNDDLAGGYSRGQGVQANDFASWWSGGRVKEERTDRHSADPCTGCLTFDGEPDLFYYEIPGRTGMFVLDYSGKAWTIPYSNLMIDLQSDNTFLITDESGIKYSFTLTERTTKISHSDRQHTGTSDSPYGQNSKIENYISSWHLTEIEDLYGEKVTFFYQWGDKISYENKNYSQLDNDPVRDESVYFETSLHYLQRIVWNTGRLEFITSRARSDLQGGRCLDRIDIYSTENIFRKSVRFTYSTFASQRLRLDKIEEVSGPVSVILGKYEYYTDYNLPFRESKDIDHWGYYNGAGNSSWFPAAGANREPSFRYTQANLLKKAFNSMGGYNEYEYEANTISGGETVGGVRIKSIKTGDANGHVQTVSYLYAGGTSFNTYKIYSNAIGNQTLKYSYSTINLHDVGGSNIYYSEVTENLPNGSQIISRFTTYKDADCNDVKSLDYINANEGKENPDISLFPNSSRFWRRGLLKEEISKNALGREVKHIVNTYRFPANPKKCIKGFFEQSFMTALGLNIDHVIVYDWISEPVYLEKEVIDDLTALTFTRSFVYDTIRCVPLEEITDYENGDIYKKTTRYAYSYGGGDNPSGIKEKNDIDFLVSLGLKFVPIEKVEYKNNQVVAANLMTYKKYQVGDNKFVPVAYKKKVLGALPVEASSFVPSVKNSSRQFIHDSRYETVQTFDSYDLQGRLTSWYNKDGIRKSVVYPAEGNIPVAEIENARHAIPEYMEIRDSIMEGYNSNELGYLSIKEGYTYYIRLQDCFPQPAGERTIYFIDLYQNKELVKRQSFQTFLKPLNLQSIKVPPGSYRFKLWMKNLGARDTVLIDEATYYNIRSRIVRPDNIRINEVFYTGFEEDVNAIVPAGKAKTGEKVYNRVLSIDLKNMLAGEYTLSYWKSIDNGTSWQCVEEPLEITASSLNYDIGSSSCLIDEVRLLPRDAFLSSCTFIPGVGNISETDANGLTVYYEYDSLGRLIRVLDNERRTIRGYEYFIDFK